MFNPESNISKAEAIGMMVKAAYGDDYSYDENNSNSWQKQVVDFAVSNGIVANFSNYDDNATRGFTFLSGDNAINASDEVADSCDEVSQLLGLCDESTESTDTSTEESTDTSTEEVVISGDNVLTAELSAMTPA